MPKISGAKQIINPDEKEKICREVLTSLPEWSGKDKSIDVHAAACRMLPLWADIDEGTVRGFIALRETSPYAAEIYVMGVKKEYQRHKIGKGMFTALLNYARRQGYEYLQVKTVKEGTSEQFDTANTFYQSLGFRELEVLPLWSETISSGSMILYFSSTKSCTARSTGFSTMISLLSSASCVISLARFATAMTTE